MTHAPVEALGLTHPEAELTVLESMRQGEEDAVQLAQLLEPDEFYDTRRAVVFEAIRNILRGIEPVDTDSIVAECLRVCRVREHKFRIDASYVEQLVGTGRKPESYAHAVKRLGWLRQAADFAFWLVQELQTRPDPEQLYTEAQERWQHIKPARTDRTFVYGWDTIQRHAETIRERIRQQEEGVISRFDWPWRSWGDVRPLRPGMVGLLAAADGMGKCLGKGTKVLMYDGSLKAVENIIVGDKLMGPDSRPRRVLSLGRGRDQMYWIHQKGGISYRVNSEHILSLYERKDILKNGRKSGARKEYIEISVKDALDRWSPGYMRRYIQGYKHPVDWNEKPVSIPPYMLGLWLGDGHANSTQFQITNADAEVTESIHDYADSLNFTANGREFQGKVHELTLEGNAANTYSIGFGVKGARSEKYKANAPVPLLKDMDVHGNKHIPLAYKANSRQVRLELLAGLIDSDGWYQSDSKCFGITMNNKPLMYDVKFLADSLGYRTKIIERVARSQNGTESTVWRLTISGDCNAIPTRIARKQAEPRLINKDWRMWAIEIEPDTIDDYYGFEIDGDGLFLLEDMTVTHNTTYLECIAEHWAQRGWHVVYVHLEDAFDYKMDRRLARHSTVQIDRIEDGLLGDLDRKRIRDAEHEIAQWAGCLHYYHAAGRTMGEIISELQARHAEGVCQAVVFDYLDKVQPTRAQGAIFGDNTWERQAHDMEQLKSFCETYNLPAMTATQGNKSMQNRGTQTRQSIQGTGQKSQKSQLVVILSRDLVGDDGLRDKDGQQIAGPGEYSPICKLRVDKQNRGKTFSFRQVLVGKYFRVADIQRSGPAGYNGPQ